MNKLFINLLNFNSNQLAGAGFFIQRLISKINFDDSNWSSFSEIVVLSNNNVDSIKLFKFKNSSKIKVVKFRFVSNFISRIFFEQFLLPFYLIGSKGVFFSPTPSIPILGNKINCQLQFIPTIHDMIPFIVKEKYSFFRRIYVKWITKSSAIFSDKIITVSCSSKKDISLFTGVDPSKISVVYNFIPNTSFYISLISEPYFLTICTIEPGKNLENMILGFNKFLSKFPEYSHFKYFIIGNFGWNFKSIIKLINNLGLDDNVILTGYLSNFEKNKFLEKCSGMLYLSKYEGFGIPPLEGLYFGKISIVSNLSSLPEVVGKAGIVQDPFDIDLISENLHDIIVNQNKYLEYIPEQINKFNPEIQLSTFIKVLSLS